MKVLVTGATGFLGTNLVRELARAGHQVHAFALAVRGMDAVFHVAGDTSFWKKNFARQQLINVDGTENVARACLEDGVKRLIHTSTVDALGYNPKGLAAEDWAHYNYGGTGYNYADTKRAGEQLVLGYAERGLDVVVINPGSMLGPYDHTLQFGRIFAQLRDRKLPAVLPGGAPWAHVKEVARAQVRALSSGRSGERYITGGVNATYRELFDLMAAKVGVRPPRFTMSPRLTVVYGYLAEAASSFTNRPPELNPGQARYMVVFPRYDSTKACRELNFKCVPLAEMVDDAHRWYVKNHFL